MKQADLAKNLNTLLICYLTSFLLYLQKITEDGFDLSLTSKLMELHPACFLYVLCTGKHDLACLLSKLMQ